MVSVSRDGDCLCAWTQQGVSFHPLWSLCLMFLLRACVPQIRQTDCVHILWDGMETDVADQLGIHDAHEQEVSLKKNYLRLILYISGIRNVAMTFFFVFWTCSRSLGTATVSALGPNRS